MRVSTDLLKLVSLFYRTFAAHGCVHSAAIFNLLSFNTHKNAARVTVDIVTSARNH